MGHRRAGYDRIGTTYTATRATDPVIAAVIRAAIGDARTVINVGAETGSYEPDDLNVTAVEPSATMIAQRPAAAAPAVQASADALPFANHSFDVAMAIISDHHWDRRLDGLAELRRVAERIVLVNAAPAAADAFWLSRDYLTGFRDLIPPRYRAPGVWEAELDEVLGDVEVRVLPVPANCCDGFYSAFWRRPAAYLDPGVRAGVSVFDRMPSAHVARAIATLENAGRKTTVDERGSTYIVKPPGLQQERNANRCFDVTDASMLDNDGYGAKRGSFKSNRSVWTARASRSAGARGRNLPLGDCEPFVDAISVVDAITARSLATTDPAHQRQRPGSASSQAPVTLVPLTDPRAGRSADLTVSEGSSGAVVSDPGRDRLPADPPDAVVVAQP